jgi:NTE family protein
MTFPLVFKPIMKDSVPLFDGGIYDNFPVQPMKKAFKPDIIIGSSVAGGKKKQPQEMDMYDLMENMVMQQTVYDIDPKDGIMMKFLLENVSLLDFNKSKTLFDMGYQYATGMIDSIKSRVERRVPAEEVNARRSEYNSNLPPLVFNHIYITGINEAQKSFIESQIHRNRENQFTIADFKKMYFRLLANPKIKEILPHAVWDPEKESFDLYLDIQIRNEITMAFGGNVSSISANQLYLGLGYQSLTEISSGIRLDMQVGNTYTGAALLGKVEIPSAISFDISGMLVYNYRKFYESEKLFIDTDIMTFIHQRESFGKISAGFPFHNNSKLDFLLGYGTLDDKYYQNTTNSSYNKENLDRSNYHLFSTGVSYKKYSQDAKQYPIRGQDHRVNLQYLSGNEKFLPYVKDRITPVNYHSWLQLDASLYNLHTMSNKFNFGYDLQGMASTKELLNNYTASVLQAPAYTPTPHSKLIMNEAFRANQFIAGGIIPILKINSSLFIRGDFHGFLPVFPIQRNGDNKAFYGDLFTKPAHLEEVSLIFQLSFISVGLYANHYSYPDKNWNFGLNIGYLIFNPKFIP